MCLETSQMSSSTHRQERFPSSDNTNSKLNFKLSSKTHFRSKHHNSRSARRPASHPIVFNFPLMSQTCWSLHPPWRRRRDPLAEVGRCSRAGVSWKHMTMLWVLPDASLFKSATETTVRLGNLRLFQRQHWGKSKTVWRQQWGLMQVFWGTPMLLQKQLWS